MTQLQNHNGYGVYLI